MIKKIYIKGMHCVACEKLLEDELSKIPFVKGVKADIKKAVAEIRYGNREPNTAAIKEIVKRLGYAASENPWEEKDARKKAKTRWSHWAASVLIVLIVLFAFRIFQNFNIFPDFGAKNPALNYGISIIIGLVASVSSCLAVVGGVLIAFSEKYKSEGKGFYRNAVRPNLFFHFGRLGAFFLLGGLLGFIGGEINISGNFVSVYTIIIALVMFILALNILGITPSISSFGVRMPKSFTSGWTRLKDSNHKAAPFVLGVLSFFLPCGMTQSMQIFALTSGSYLVGGISLFLFALGTVPALLVLGITVSWTKSKRLVIFQKAAGIIVLLFAVYTFNSGMALSGVKTDVLTSQTQKEDSLENKASDIQNEQVVRMKITSRGFEPSVLQIKKGIPVKWVIEGDQVTSCTNKIIIPSLNISQSISRETIIRFTSDKSGEIPFSCWMGMVRGKFIVK